MAKSTFGTGGFILLNTGAEPIAPAPPADDDRLSVRWPANYALEGSIFSAGATVQWLRDGARDHRKRRRKPARSPASADPEQRIYLVPAFAGLGAPHWNSEVRGAITGVTRGATRKEIVRAALESVAYQTRDLIEAMKREWPTSWQARSKPIIRVDGGMVASDWTMQFLADILDAPVDRPTMQRDDRARRGVSGGVAGRRLPGPEELTKVWNLERRFTPTMSDETRRRRRAGWQSAVEATLHRREPPG